MEAIYDGRAKTVAILRRNLFLMDMAILVAQNDLEVFFGYGDSRA